MVAGDPLGFIIVKGALMAAQSELKETRVNEHTEGTPKEEEGCVWECCGVGGGGGVVEGAIKQEPVNIRKCFFTNAQAAETGASYR